MAKKVQVQHACRDCAMCTGHAFTGVGRSLARGTADTFTFGVTALARRKCKLCDHPMSEHQGQASEAVTVSPPASNEPAQPGTLSRTHAMMQSALSATANKFNKPNPARWVEQSDGQYRWWGGDSWSDHYTADPQTPDPTIAAEVHTPAQISPVPAGIDTESDHVTQLKKLAELRDAGILTDEEFSTKKTEILSRM